MTWGLHVLTLKNLTEPRIKKGPTRATWDCTSSPLTGHQPKLYRSAQPPPPPQDLQWEGIFSLFSEKIPSVFFNLLVTSQRIKTKSPRKEVKRWENANLLSKHTQWQLWFILLCTGYTPMNLEICRDIKLFKTNRCYYQWLLRPCVIAFFTGSLELMDHRKSAFECPVVFYFLEKWPVFSIIQILFLQIYGMNFSCTSCLTAVK